MSDAADRPTNPDSVDLLAKAGPGRSRMSTLEPALQRLNDRFSRFLRAALLQHLRRAVTVVPTGIQVVEYRELLEGFPSPVHLTLFNMKPLRGTLVLMFEIPLVVAIVESRFGGSGRFPINLTNRDFTPFELKSMRSVVELSLDQMKTAWEPIGHFEIETVRHETNAQFAGFAAAEDLIIVNTFDITVDHGVGKLGIYIPHPAIDPLHDQLSLGVVSQAVDHDPRWSSALKDRVGQASITLNAELGKIEISIGDLATLRPGNVFEMDRPQSVVVHAGGVPLFRGRWGRHGSKIGVLVDERLSPAGRHLIELADEDRGAADGG
jgi:flagellar motor switch protein FliM